MADLLDLEARVAALEGGDAIFGSIETLTRSAAALGTTFGAAPQITLRSTNLYPAPIQGDIYRVHQSGVIFHNSAGSPAHTLAFGIDLPTAGTGQPGAVGLTGLAAGFTGRYYRLSANVIINNAGEFGDCTMDSSIVFSADIYPAGYPGANPPVVIDLAGTPHMLRQTTLTPAMDLREPTLNVVAGLVFGPLDANLIVIAWHHYVERLANRGV